MLKCTVQLSNVQFQLLPHSHGLGFGLAFSLNVELHLFKLLGMIPSGTFEFFFLFLNTFFNVSSDLIDLQIQPQEFVFFLLKSRFRISQSSFKLEFFLVQFLTLLFNLMDGSSPFADLLHKILDFVSQGFVLTTNIIELYIGFFITIFDSKEFS